MSCFKMHFNGKKDETGQRKSLVAFYIGFICLTPICLRRGTGGDRDSRR